jgi:hypothetical protein
MSKLFQQTLWIGGTDEEYEEQEEEYEEQEEEYEEQEEEYEEQEVKPVPFHEGPDSKRVRSLLFRTRDAATWCRIRISRPLSDKSGKVPRSDLRGAAVDE